MNILKPKSLQSDVFVIKKHIPKNLTDSNLFIIFYANVFDYQSYFELIDEVIEPFKTKILAYGLDINYYPFALQKCYAKEIHYGRKTVKIMPRNISYVPTHLIVGKDSSCSHYEGLLKKHELELLFSDIYINDRSTLVLEQNEFNLEDF